MLHPSTARERIIAAWLLLCCAMIFAMVVLGGVTRLTGSGLSMVEWDPIFGVVPPLNPEAWTAVFEKYRASPEYQQVNMHMDVEDFKSIYWFEFTHRLLGRTIGTVFLLPFLYFLWRGWLQRPLVPKLIGMFVLGGLQGALGWYMVASGLIDNPHVSQYRLTAHLVMAFLIYGFIFWTALDLLYPACAVDETVSRRLRAGARLFLTLVVVTVSSGGLVAGLKAGFAYSTFPLMDGHLVPEAIFLFEPRWRNFFENIATVQFDHRVLATLVLIGGVTLWLATRNLSGALCRRAYLLLGMIGVQITLGISTLLLHVPIALASLHQAGALVLFTLTLYLLHGVQRAVRA
ncbi:MAG: COX15/CtaA family protein [Gammaproteobacteria bacterium]|nr:COX15/CtaA family protein [Gammaproteobacteria bacterium]